MYCAGNDWAEVGMDAAMRSDREKILMRIAGVLHVDKMIVGGEWEI